MAKINERVTSEQFYDYIRRFGFGEKSRIDLPGEHPGKIRHPRDRSVLSDASLSIGQEISVTPLQPQQSSRFLCWLCAGRAAALRDARDVR